MQRLLTLKHWQIFIILVIIPIACTLWIPDLFISKNQHFGITLNYALPSFFGFFTFLFFYLLGKNLMEKLPKGRINSTLFTICAILLMSSDLIKIISIFLALTNQNISVNYLSLILIPFGYLIIPSILYCAFVLAKVLKTVENPDGNFEILDVLTEFILFILFPIGIWILQPRINKIFDTNLQEN